MWGETRTRTESARALSLGLHRLDSNHGILYSHLTNGQPPPATQSFPPSAAFYNGNGVPYAPYHIPMAYVEQWHLSVQHQFSDDTMLEVAYVGFHGVKLVNPSDMNQVPEAGIQQIIAAGGIALSCNPIVLIRNLRALPMSRSAAGQITTRSRSR